MTAILYRSRARTGLMAPDLNAIIAASRAWNEPRGLTGLLVYGDMPMVPGAPGEFVQWVEGPDAEVDAVFGKIHSDRRHYEIEVLARGSVRDLTGGVHPERLFPSWTMGLVRLGSLPASLQGFLDFAERWSQDESSTPPRPGEDARGGAER